MNEHIFHHFKNFYNNINIYPRFFLLKKTMLPYGRFLKWWEGFRSIFAFISCMVFPPLIHLSVSNPSLLYLCGVLDILGMIDM